MIHWNGFRLWVISVVFVTSNQVVLSMQALSKFRLLSNKKSLTEEDKEDESKKFQIHHNTNQLLNINYYKSELNKNKNKTARVVRMHETCD